MDPDKTAQLFARDDDLIEVHKDDDGEREFVKVGRWGELDL